MVKYSCIVLLALSFIFNSCETSTDVSTALKYQEYTVIDAKLSAGKFFEGVRITHTLPLGEEYDIHKAEIIDAIAYIRENGVKVIPIHYTSEGLYKTITEIHIKAGTQYELFADINGKSVYSSTFVPDTPVVNQVFNANNNYLIAEVSAKPNEAYGAAWIIPRGIDSLIAGDFHSILTADHFPSDITLRTIDIPAPYNTPAYSDLFYIKVFAFDKAYKDYFETRTSSEPIEETFTSGGGAVAWNVYGKNVIGLFIGTAEGYMVHP